MLLAFSNKQFLSSILVKSPGSGSAKLGEGAAESADSHIAPGRKALASTLRLDAAAVEQPASGAACVGSN